MSKLLDSLTGYFFSAEQSGATATATADAPTHGRRQSLTGSDSVDAVPGDTDDGWRLRDRLRLRRPIHRAAPAASGRLPWGDEDVASPRVHPLASIDPRAELAADVAVGPFCVIGPHVTLGPGCRLHNNVTLSGHTTVGSDNVFFPNCVIGTAPQDKKFRGEPTRLVIGDGNMIREAVTIHVGTAVGGGVTQIGDNNLLMVNCHVGHDVKIGNDCVLGNNVMLAGHCEIGSRVSLMGGAALHHFVSVGDYAFIGGYSRIHYDVPPYVKVDGADEIRAINVVGLRRGGINDDDIAALDVAGRRLFIGRKKPMAVVIRELMAEENLNARAREMIDFLRRRNLGRHGRYLESLRTA